MSPRYLEGAPELGLLETIIKQKIEDLRDHRTAKLWLQYLDMVEKLLKFIRAERLGLWDLYLQVAAEMLPYLAASGHNLYVKSVWLYIQEMTSTSSESSPKNVSDVQ